MAQIKTQMDLVAEAWERFSKALENAKAIADRDGSTFINLWEVERAVDDLRDEMVQAGVIDVDIHEDF